ncbi:hypothetical protein FB451DRAFT_1170568 [Mycena latifolia]|nr:hypothetical protein FB451DRAFT_1170568 [Mycena latifolia]
MPDETDSEGKPLPALPAPSRLLPATTTKERIKGKTPPTTLAVDARAHRARIVRDVLSCNADPALAPDDAERWASAVEGALDALGDAVGQWCGAGGWVATDSPRAVRRPCRFHRRRCPPLRLHDPAAVLYGLDGWNGAGTLVGWTFTLACVSSPSAYPALHTALRLAVYLHLALLLEQHFLFDSAAGSPSSSWPAVALRARGQGEG